MGFGRGSGTAAFLEDEISNNQYKGKYPMKKIPLVDMFDFKTQQTTRIPASELSPGMIFAEVLDVGEVWVDVRQTKPGVKRRHKSLEPDLIFRVLWVKAALEEVYPMSLDKWIDGFLCDIYPVVEINRWVCIAMAYQYCTEGKVLGGDEKREYFNVILQSSFCPNENMFEELDLIRLTRSQAIEASEVYFAIVPK